MAEYLISEIQVPGIGDPLVLKDTKVTSAENHYAPVEDTSAQLSADASSTTAAEWDSTSLVTGVDIKRDAKGHVVGVEVDSIKMPANPGGSDTKVTQTNTQNIDADYCLLLAENETFSTETATARKNANLRYNTSNLTLKVQRLQNGRTTTASGNYSHAEGYSTCAAGEASHAEGYLTTARYSYDHTEGTGTVASGNYSHAEGYNTRTGAQYSHAEGNRTCAAGTDSHAEGYMTTASGFHSHAEGGYSAASSHNIASGEGSHVEGTGTTTYGRCSHAEGNCTCARGDYSHAEGYHTRTGSSSYAHAEGYYTSATGSSSHAEGYYTCADANYSHAEGNHTKTKGESSHAEGYYTCASGNYSHAEGYRTCATNVNSLSIGHYNAAMTTGGSGTNTTGTAFVIGNGTGDSALKNAFSVQFDGTVKAAKTITASTTADYAEYFEWADENPDKEDRVGRFVTFDDGNKIRIANDQDDYILGVVSGAPFVLGNGDCDVWNGMVVRDNFGRIIYEPAQKMEFNEETGKEEPVYDEDGKPVYEGTAPMINPDYDPTIPYINRADRPEWAPIGMLGILAVLDDGTCEVNEYCTVKVGGIATKAESSSVNKYRVIKRKASNVIDIVFR